MNQFKDVFTGREKRDYARATTAQKCVRAGGKHNDLDNVGYTGRHHTFFEMLGNFSFGDYFKDEAIAFAWELVTDREKGYGLDPERLWATVYTDDDEAARLWERHLPAARGSCASARRRTSGRWGRRAPAARARSSTTSGARTSRATRPDLVNGPGDDTLEIWNLVFMQFERDASGKMTPLPRPSVDTGAGLERLTRDPPGRQQQLRHGPLRADPRAASSELSGQTYRGGMAPGGRALPRHRRPRPRRDDAHRRRRPAVERGARATSCGGSCAARCATAAGSASTQPFLHRLAPTVVEGFAGVYFEPADVASRRRRRSRACSSPEEERFGKTLSEGADRVGEAIERLRREGATALSGETVFRFYDTYGIPLEVIEEIARRRGRRGRPRRLRGGDGAPAGRLARVGEVRGRRRLRLRAAGAAGPHSVFRGYPEQDFVPPRGRARARDRAGTGAKPRCSSRGRERGRRLRPNRLLSRRAAARSPTRGRWRWDGRPRRGHRRAEAGAEPDRPPRRRCAAGRLELGAVVDMDGPGVDAPAHAGQPHRHAPASRGAAQGPRAVGASDGLARGARTGCASTTRRRAPTTPEQIAEIERLVNEEILRDQPVTKEIMPMDEARRRGRRHVLRREVRRAGPRRRGAGLLDRALRRLPRPADRRDRGLQDRLGPGHRRRACAGSRPSRRSARWSCSPQDEQHPERARGRGAGSPRELLPARWQEREERVKALEREVASLKLKLASGDAGSQGERIEVGGVPIVTRIVEGLSIPELRNLSDTLRSKLKSGVVAVGTVGDGKTSVIIAVTPDLTKPPPGLPDRRRASGKALAGSGGGKPDLAQAGGKNAELLPGGPEGRRRGGPGPARRARPTA